MSMLRPRARSPRPGSAAPRAALPCAALGALALAASAAQTPAPRLLTLEETVGRGASLELVREPPTWRWAPDGRRLVREDVDGPRWVDPTTWEETVPTPASDGSGGGAAAAERGRAGGGRGQGRARPDLAPAFQALDGVSPELAQAIVARPAGTSADQRTSLFLYAGLWVHREGQGAARLVAEEVELARLSPDASRVAFVQENDLHVVAVDGGAVTHLTTNGGASRLNGKLDWVYQEEIYGRGDFQGHWWSPDSQRLAFLSIDESPVHEFTLVDHVESGHYRVKPEVTRYPKAGDPNPRVTLGVADVRTGAVTWVDVAAHAEAEPLIVGVGWRPDGARLLYVVQDRVQSWADLVAWDPLTGAAETWIAERSDTWVERPAAPRWLADGGFLWCSDRTGQHHVYRYSATGKALGAVTAGAWCVREIKELDEERGLVWFTGTKDGAVDVNLYRVGLDGSGLKRLTQGPGTHTVAFADDRSSFIDTVSSLSSPPEVRLCSAEGEVLKVLGRAEVNGELLLSTWELVQIPARDGFVLDAAVLRPVPFEPTRAHPVWITTYSGPDAPTVRNRWNAGAWPQFLAQRGLVVFEVNVRSASGKGHWATSQCYKRLGVQELADLEDAVAWLTSQPWADAARVGITGHSYGGFMAAYALTHSERFALGIAGSGVYDWRMYDSVYTERYMRTPAENPEGYEASSVVGAAAKLHGHLLLTHGEIDDNVHLQNAYQLALALQRAEKPFEMMVYPQARHGLRDGAQRWFARQQEWETIRRILLEPRADASTEG